MKPYILAPKADMGYQLILDYIAFHFTETRALRYEVELFAALAKLCQNPERCPVNRIIDGLPVRKYIFQEKTIILYSEREAFVSIDVIADARTDWK